MMHDGSQVMGEPAVQDSVASQCCELMDGLQLAVLLACI
jgi:hypothetical protein